jgi:hypothetical protein
MGSSDNQTYHIREKENFERRKRKAKKDLILIIFFLLLITGVALVWLLWFSETVIEQYEPEVVEIIIEEVGTEELPVSELPVRRQPTKRKEYDSLGTLDHKDGRVDSAHLGMEEAQRIKSMRILSEVDVRLRQLEQRKKYIRNHFQNFIFTQQSNYFHSEEAGISNLFITIHNVSEFYVDLVVIDIQYIEPEEGIVNNHTLSFNGIEARGQLTLKAPDSSRGRIVTHIISRISSRSLDFCYSPEKWHKNTDDPYKCSHNDQ